MSLLQNQNDRGSIKAFTLIESLTVIGIIAIVAAILFSVFGSARERSRQSACLSNLSQLGKAISQYEQDNDECPPNGVSHTNTDKGWGGQIYPYVKSVDVYICPDDTTPQASCSYVYNNNFVYQPAGYRFQSGQTIPSYTLSKFAQPDKTVMLTEITGSAGYNIADLDAQDKVSDDYWRTPTAESGYTPDGMGCGRSYDPFTTTLSPTNQPCNIITGMSCQARNYTLMYATGYPYNAAACNPIVYNNSAGRHNSGANYVMADGHAKWLPGGRVFAGTNNKKVADCSSQNATPPVAMNTECSLSNVEITWSIF